MLPIIAEGWAARKRGGQVLSLVWYYSDDYLSSRVSFLKISDRFSSLT